MMNCTWKDDVDETLYIFTSTTNCSMLFDNISRYLQIGNHTRDEPLYDVPLLLIVLLSIFYGTISVLAVVGNALVMWIVATSRRMQNVTNCFIANLALADIVIGLFAIPFQFQAALLQRWNLPDFMCPFCPFVQVLTVNVSVFTLTAIAVDRHRAILNPLSARPSKLRAKLFIACIWGIAGFLAAPMAIALRVSYVEEDDPIGRVRLKPFCRNMTFSERQMMVYRVVLVFVQYFTPLCVISFVYSRMALRLWGSRAPGNAQDSRDANLMKNKKKVIKMLVIVVALFAFCWFPLQTYNLLQDIFPDINKYRYINIIWFCCDWLAMSNSCYNPFIYGIYNEKFKREFQQRFQMGGKSKRWMGSETTHSVDLDKTSYFGTRSTFISHHQSPSLSLGHHHNSPSLSIGHQSPEWRRSYSIANNGYRRGHVTAEKDMYVFQAPNSTHVVTHVNDELEELCL
uniref:Neuropeptide GPCR A23 n=1 Tax=Nilaparvata lugens TaxID=108931 RepID=U3UA04_NILLU|nr:neuropeptide GPCR A23 [Nilaparvata lugens]